ncbi:hypothetical protein CBS101457_006919 [Exobasidium rhododendri]|nr:hypothetical protein CBS101457_006919 [Exobasidium rhododendri]
MASSTSSVSPPANGAPTAPWEIPFIDSSKLGFQLANRYMNQDRPFKILCIGAGLSGIYAGVRIPRSMHGTELIIVDKNSDFGGTWFENRYEGCACDIPSHCYQFAFEPNHNWTSFYAPATEICAYWKSVAIKYKVDQLTRFNTTVSDAKWDGETGKWTVSLENTAEKKKYDIEADVVIQATGSLNAWKWPDVKGLKSFKGPLVHSAVWDDTLDVTNKRVALIGSGSTAIQILPRLAPRVKTIDQYVRSPTWIGFPFLTEEVQARDNAVNGNFKYPESEKVDLAKDPKKSHLYRKMLSTKLNQMHQVTQLGTAIQDDARKAMAQEMRNRLGSKTELAEFLLPKFPVGAKRLTPGPGFLEAFERGDATMITKGVKEATEEGLIDEDGTLRQYDVIICATGFDTSFAPRFPVTGENGLTLTERWSKFPETYMSLCVDGFPNYFTVNGPNSVVGTGDLVILFQTEIDFAIKCAQKLRTQHYKTMQPKKEAVQEFQEYSQTYFKQTVFGQPVRSWYKAGAVQGPVYALWPGSCVHAVRTLSNPRWEDFNFTKFENPHSEQRTNRFDYLGNGSTVEEEMIDGVVGEETAWYITEPNPVLAYYGQADGAHIVNLLSASNEGAE